MDDSRIKSIGSLLRAFFDDEQIRKGGEYADFFSSWKSIAGLREAGHSRVAEVDKGVLIVEVDHPGWIQLLQLKQSSILATAQERFPELKLRSIAFRLAKDSPGGGSGGRSPVRPGPFGPEGRDLPEGSAVERKGPSKTISLESIDDPELRARLEALKKAMEGEKNTQD
jgi:hypothetical protein